MHKNNTTLKDIAKAVGVSATAVSNALRNKGNYSEETRRKIWETAAQMNYSPNAIARSLRMNNTNTLGVVVSDSSFTFIASVVKGIEDTASKNGYNIILCNTNSQKAKEKDAIKILMDKRVDGLILAASMLTSKEDIEYLNSFKIPYVYMIRRSTEVDHSFVINDNYLGAYQMVDYLIKTGSRKIHFVNIIEGTASYSNRLLGYKDALSDNGIEFDRDIVYSVKPTIDEGFSAIKSILAKDDNIETVFCGCDTIAIGVMDAILESGLKIPDNIRVASYDDIEYAAYLRVPLTTVRQPKYKIGQVGTEVLIEKIENPNTSIKNIVLKPDIIIRKST